MRQGVGQAPELLVQRWCWGALLTRGTEAQPEPRLVGQPEATGPCLGIQGLRAWPWAGLQPLRLSPPAFSHPSKGLLRDHHLHGPPGLPAELGLFSDCPRALRRSAVALTPVSIDCPSLPLDPGFWTKGTCRGICVSRAVLCTQ